MPSDRKLIIIGAGASGLAAAAAAAGKGASVTVLEREKSAALKLLRTGSGRCNLTNLSLSSEFYEERGLAFAEQVLQSVTVQDTLNFFRSIGLFTRDYDGLVYPYNEEAQAVRDVLLNAARDRGARIRLSTDVCRIRHEKETFLVTSGDWTYEADGIIAAFGSSAGLPEGTEDGLKMLRELGHPVYDPSPALTALSVKGGVQSLAGLRVHGEAALYADGVIRGRERGQIQFTAKGISGICVMNLSARADALIKAGHNVELSVNAVPDLPEDAEDAVHSILPQKLERFLRESRGETSLCAAARDIRFPVAGVLGLPYAQVCAGGVDTSSVDPSTMMSRIIPHLYFAGEVLDVTGRCGGANLQFAWSSGILAGRNAAQLSHLHP